MTAATHIANITEDSRATDPKRVFDFTDFDKTKEDFHWSDKGEPHALRRKAILAAHPEIKELFGPEWKTLPMVLFSVALNLFVSYQVRNASWPVVVLAAWAISGTITHSLQLAAHELSHNLCFNDTPKDEFLGIICNIGAGVPSSATFRRYHMEHHQYQGVEGIDTDIPTKWEIGFFGNNTLAKLVWMFMQPFFYAIRPLFVKPKTPNKATFLNAIIVIAVDIYVLSNWGAKSLFYLIGGALLGLGLHPMAGHFLSEHYEFVKGVETYSYYGPLNYLAYNVGYHNEHHDFPKIPWSRLPRVREIAPEFYHHLHYHTSWTAVIWQYITDPEMGPFSRVKRVDTRKAQRAARLQKKATKAE